MKRALLVLVACGGESQPPAPAPRPPADAARPVAPARIVLGDCAAPATTFLSGPRPAAPTEGAGHGSGYGVGGRGRGGPVVKLDVTRVDGALESKIVGRYLKRHAARLAFCYEKQLQRKPSIKGTVALGFSISEHGEVHAITSAGVDPLVATCVRGAVSSIEFPKPESGTTTVAATLRYAPPPGWTPLDAPPPAPKQPLPPPYVPGAMNPLSGLALGDCLAKADRPYGVAVVDFAYADGHVSDARVHGLTGDAASCVVALARTAKPKHAVAAERCSLAFGTQPAVEAPRIHVTGEQITARARGKTITLGGGRGAPLHELDPIFAAPPSEPVSIHGPLLVRTISTNTMRVLNRLLNRARNARELDVVLAERIPRGIELPVVPVPAGTGGSWTQGPRGAISVAVVTPDSIIVDETLVPGRDWARVTELLAQRQVYAHAIELAAHDDVTIADLEKLADIVIEQQWSMWRVSDPLSTADVRPY